MKIDFDTNEYIEKIRKEPNQYFHTFINHENLAGGVLVLKPGEEDTQTPHESDELYYVVKGNGFLKINKKDYPAFPGKVYYVQKNIEHYFFGNTEELIVLYFFGGPDI